MAYLWYEIIVTDFKNEREVKRIIYKPPVGKYKWARFVLGVKCFWLQNVRYSPQRYRVQIVSHAK